MQSYLKEEVDTWQVTTGYGYDFTYPSNSTSKLWTRNAFAPKTSNFSGWRNPSWRTLVIRGENASTDASGILHKYIPISVGQTHLLVYGYRFDTQKRKNHYWWHNSADITQQTFEAGDVVTQATIDAVSMGFMKKYRETLTAFSGGVFLGELRESIRMLRNPAAALRAGIDTYVDRIKKVRWIRGKDPRKRYRYVRDSWLEYSFGVKPLLNDIESAVKALQSNPQYEDQMIRFRGEQTRVVAEAPYQGTYAGTQCKFLTTRTRRYQTFYNLYGKVRVSHPGTNPQWKYWGVSLQDVLPTIWELIPNSFLIDYFANIGDLIEFYSTNWSSLRWVSSSESRRFRCQIHHCVDVPGTHKAYKPQTWPDYPELIDVYGSPSLHEIQTRTFRRTASAHLSAPSLQFKLPGTSTKFLNLAALARLGRSRP